MTFRKRSGGFTLVELLVVIGIIAILVAILLSAVTRARRPAIVLVSPVTYIGNDSRLYLTNHSGGTSLNLVQASPVSCPVCHVPPSWSPSGNLVATQVDLFGGGYTTKFVDPASGQVTTRADTNDRVFIAWLDSDRYVTAPSLAGSVGSSLTIRHIDGRLLQTLANPHKLISITPSPPGGPAPYTGITIENGSTNIVLLDKHLSPGRAIWRIVASNYTAPSNARMDPTGQYIAWTEFGGATFSSVAYKQITDNPTRPPYRIGKEYVNAAFCDWTEGGDLLINTCDAGGNWRLAIVNLRGQLLEFINTEVPPAPGESATWRKYMHQ